MSGILPFARVQNPVWTSVAREIHAAIWDRFGLEIVQGRVREWAATWKDKAKAFAIEQEEENELHKHDADWCSDWNPLLPALPLPPSNESISLAEKWASLAAIQDVFGFTGDKVLPWPLPEDDHDLVAFTEWFKGDAGAYQLLLRRASELPESYAETVRHWLDYVKKHTHVTELGRAPEDVLPGKPLTTPEADASTSGNSLEKCEPAERKAYYSFKLAEAKKERRLEDREAYDLLVDEDWTEHLTGELADYKLPTFATWARQLRTARKATNERKYTPRTHK